MRKILLAATVAGALSALLVVCLRKKYHAPVSTLAAAEEDSDYDEDYDEHQNMYNDDLGWLHEIRRGFSTKPLS